MPRDELIERLEDMRSSITKERNYKKQVLVCCGVNCLTSGNDIILDKFQSRMKEMRLDNEINVTKTGCFGFCARGPIVEILPDKIFYTEITLDDVDKIIDKHLLKNQEIEELLYTNPLTKEKISKPKNMDFYKKQKKIALRNCGIIDPENIDDYVLADGYTALDKALKMTPEEAINAATINGAYAMGISKTHGSITKGKKANLIITKPIMSFYQLPYAFGTNLIDKVMIEGKFI